jgi:IS5 family transposase
MSLAVTPQACARVTVDTTVQTKAVAHPTDSHLMMRGIETLNRLAKRHGVKLRQSFVRVGKHAHREISRLIHGRGHKQAMRWVRKLRTWLGRLDRDGSSSSALVTPTSFTPSTPPRSNASPRARQGRATRLA